MNKTSLTTIVLTYNEEKNLETCLKSVRDISDEIIIIDSFSKDKTLEIAKKFNAQIHQREFKNQSDQTNWALDNLEIKGDWILRLDADEYLTPELTEEMKSLLSLRGASKASDTAIPAQEDINGYLIKRRVYFMNRWMKHGGYYPHWFLRLWRKGKGRYEEREVDEHLTLKEGKIAKLEEDFVDDNKNGLHRWTEKHNLYSSREVREIMKSDNTIMNKRRRLYNKFPPFLRPCLHFIYRYIFRLGFLDGKEGLIFHFLQGFWYLMIIDAKLYEYKIQKLKNND